MTDQSTHSPATLAKPAAAAAAADAAPEGVIQFAYDLRTADRPPLPLERFAQLQAWRQILRQLGLLGQDPNRYDGLGFGNMSVRDPELPGQFAITASQTGAVPVLAPGDLVRVLNCNLGRFWVDAEGSQPPSSETLTHGMIYAADPDIHWVFHCHNPEIWRRAPALELPCTAAGVGYGSPAMTAAVAQVLRRHKQRPILFVTLGHEDGLFSCGATAEQAGTSLIAALARARG